MFHRFFILATFIATNGFIPLLLIDHASTAMGQDSDRLYPNSGVTVTGRIAEMTREGVVMEVRGNRQNFPGSDINRIVYEGEPAQFSRGKELAANGQWDQAVDALKRVDARALERDDVKKEFEFYVGYVQAQLALRGQADATSAAGRLNAFSRGSPNSYHFFKVAETLGLLASNTGNHEAAARFFTAMTQSSSNETKLRGRYWLGDSLLAQSKPADAKKMFQEVTAAPAASPAIQRLQKLAEIQLQKCTVAEGKPGEAIAALRRLIDSGDNTDSQLFAQLNNALGEAFLAEGNPELAILAYLQTDLLFFSEADSHAEALFQLSDLWGKQNQPQRAADARARLQAQYSGSAWAKKQSER